VKRILYITARADYGGGPEHLLTVIKGFRDKYDLFVACPKDRPYRDLYSSFLGPEKMFEIPHRKFSIRKFLQMVWFIRKRGIGIVHSHGKGAGVYARLLKIFLPRIKVIHTFHGVHYAEKSLFSRVIHLGAEKVLRGLTDKFICVSRGELAEAQRLRLCVPRKTTVIYNGIALPDSPVSGNAGLTGIKGDDRPDPLKLDN